MLKVSPSFVLFTKLTLVAFAFTTVFRLIFLAFNAQYFNEVDLSLFFNGLRFDAISIAFGFSPVYLVLLFPFKSISNNLIKFIRAYSSIVLSVFAAVNFIDVIYYRFTLKRTTWDIFTYINAGDDFAILLPQFIKDFWYMILLFFIFSALVFVALQKFLRPEKFEFSNQNKYFSILMMISILAIGFRGGTQLKPLNIMDASRYAGGQNAALLLSTPFTLMKTIGREQLSLKKYFENEDAKHYFDPQFSVKSDSAKLKNIVVIIMESLSKEYLGYFNKNSTYTPFLDSLMRHSTVFTNAYANGKRSIEALPAIFSGLPNLMNEAFNTSPYAGNKLNSLASILKEHGYNSSFFHGGANGTMGFDSYTQLAGFDAYYGMNEYPFEDDFDGLWGIFDLPFFQYVAQKQSEFKEPFLSSIFSLSAHHPYTLPNGYKEKCQNAELEILPLICYSDLALKAYFNRVKKTSWYSNSIFLITADHTAQNLTADYNTSTGNYAIPIILFDPSIQEGIEVSNTTQQTDISPTILKYLNIPSEAIFFGQSTLDSNSEGFAINYLNNSYQYIGNKYCLKFDGSEVNAVFDFKNDKLMKNNLVNKTEEYSQEENKMKAIVQEFNFRMIENKLTND